MSRSLHGIKIPHRKNTANMSPVRIDLPKQVTIPTVMHIGAPAKPVVKVGDSVSVGTLIAEQAGFVSAPIYSSVSGKVTKISEMLMANGKYAPAITIESDGEMTVSENIQAPVINSRETLIEAVKNSGMVGLGGAGFPTYVKLSTDKKIEYLIINGAECEPYITSDSVTMVERSDDIAYAIELFCKYLDIDKVVIGIEKNKANAINAMKSVAEKFSNVSVSVLPSIYPQGGEKVLVYHTTGRVIGNGKLPIDVGCVVCNSTTMASIGSYAKTGMPLVEKCVTVDGGAVSKPANVIVPIGTALSDVFSFCGGFKEEPKKIIYGGPMMGVAVPSADVPVLKQTNAIIALTAKEAKEPKVGNCIRCGTCLVNCPFGLAATSIAKAYARGDMEELDKLKATTCMECGCCAFNCPANRPLVQTNRLAKVALAEYKANKAKEEKK